MNWGGALAESAQLANVDLQQALQRKGPTLQTSSNIIMLQQDSSTAVIRKPAA